MYHSLLPDDRIYRNINRWLAIIFTTIFLVLTALVINNSIVEVNKQLAQETEHAYDQLAEQLRSSSNVLDGFGAYFKTIDTIHYKSLEEYSNSIRQQHPHIYMTQYMVRVPKSEVGYFVSQRKKEGYATYELTQLDKDNSEQLVPVTDRGIYYPILFINPFAVRTIPLLGYDVYSHPVIRDAIDTSIESGNNYSTIPFKLYEAGLSYLMVRPIYTTSSLPADKNKRYEYATRLVAIVIRIEDLVNDISLNPAYKLNLTHRKRSSVIDNLVGFKQAENTEESILPVYEQSRTLINAGQTFKVTLQRQLYWSDIEYQWIIFSFIATAAIALLVFNFFHLRIESDREQRRTQAELFREKELAEVTLHSIGEAVITTDTRERVQYMNPIACLLTGWSNAESTGQPLGKVFRLISEETREEVTSTATESLKLQCTVRSDEPTLLINKKGDEFAIENSAALIREGGGKPIGVVLVFRNISHIRNMSKKMEFQASHDALTELINRREFEQQLKVAAQSARDDSHQHALCYLDLDQFKVVNDTCGHIAGDQLLRELAKIMPNCIRSSDCLARLGGDEFGVLMFDCPLHQASKVADNLREAIKDFTFSWDKKTFDIGVSIGLVPINKDSGSIQDIMRRADSSCYIAKDLGRNRVHIYTPDDLELTRRHGEMQWVTRIQTALEENRFQLVKQAVQSVHNNDVVHYEIMLRMIGEDGSIIPPMSFIPAAERYDLMAHLDRWVIKKAFSNIRCEIESSYTGEVYNINLSGQSLSKYEITDFIREQVKYYEIPPQCLCFEITETAIIANLGLAIDFIQEMKDIGCQFALDDFGSGLSSFTYLKKLPVDYLKIDGAFVRDLLTDPMDRAIVAAINNIGHEMGLKTVAEYVEDEHILTILKQLGVDFVQGYYIDEPKDWIVAEHDQSKPRISLVPAKRV